MCIVSVCFNFIEKETETRKAKEFAYSVPGQEETSNPGFLNRGHHLLTVAWVGGTGQGGGEDPMERSVVEVVGTDLRERP